MYIFFIMTCDVFFDYFHIFFFFIADTNHNINELALKSMGPVHRFTKGLKSYDLSVVGYRLC